MSPQVKTADETEIKTQVTNEEFAKLKAEYDRINDAAAVQKKQTDVIDLVDDIVDKKIPFQNLVTEDIWIEEDIFDNNDKGDIIDTSKDIIKDIKNIDPFLDFSIPTDAIIDYLFEPSDDDEPDFIIAEPAVSNEEIIIPDTTHIGRDTGPSKRKKFVTTRMKGAVSAAERIKKIYKKQKKIRELSKQNKKATDWLRQAGYLNTEDLDAIKYNYIFNINKDIDNDKKDTDIGETIDLKKNSNTQRVAKSIVEKYKNLARKKLYAKPTPQGNIDPPNEISDENENIINDIETIADLQRGISTQIAAKKSCEKYKKIRTKKKRPASPKIVELPTTSKIVEVPTETDRPKKSSKIAAKRLQQKYKNIRRKKALKNVLKNVLEQEIDRPVSTKSTQIAATKISDKYKKMRSKKAIKLVEEVQQAASNKSAQ